MWEEMVSPVALSIKDSLWQNMCHENECHEKIWIPKVKNGLSLLYFLGIWLSAEVCLTKI